MMGELIDLEEHRRRRGYYFKEAAESEIRLEELREAMREELARRAFCLTQIGFYPNGIA